MYYGTLYSFVFFKDGLPTNYSLDVCLSMHSIFCESSLLWMPSIHKDVVNTFFKVAEVLFCSDSGYAKTATPCTSHLLIMFTPGPWDHNINTEQNFPAISCFKTGESGQTGKIISIHSGSFARYLTSKMACQTETKLLGLNHSNHRSEWKHQWE